MWTDHYIINYQMTFKQKLHSVKWENQFKNVDPESTGNLCEIFFNKGIENVQYLKNAFNVMNN